MKIVYKYEDGYTFPGGLPVIRSSGNNDPLLVQQHEILHYSFYTSTSLGNAINILLQLSQIARGTDIGKTANKLYNEWNNSIMNSIEGTICYVSFIRTLRRKNITEGELYDSIHLQEEYINSWFEKKLIYDTLPAYNLRDELAMQTAKFCLNIPVYDKISDLNHLDKFLNTITPEIIQYKFQKCEEVLISNKGHEYILYYARLSMELENKGLSNFDIEFKLQTNFSNFMIENIYFENKDNLFENNTHYNFSYFFHGYITKSLEVVKLWNEQLKKLKIIDKDKIYLKLENLNDNMELENKCIVSAPAPSLTAPTDHIDFDSSDFKTMIDSNNLKIFFIIYEHKNIEKFIISKKYNRILNNKNCYVRIHFGENTDNDIKVLPFYLFTIIENKQTLIDKFEKLKDKNSLYICESSLTEGLLPKLSKNKLHSNFINVEWGKTPQYVIEKIKKTSSIVKSGKTSLIVYNDICFIEIIIENMYTIFPLVGSSASLLKKELENIVDIKDKIFPYNMNDKFIFYILKHIAF